MDNAAQAATAKRTLLLIGLFALSLRFGLMLELGASYPLYFTPPPATDMAQYHQLAVRLSQGDFGDQPIYWNPAYYHLLGLLYATIGTGKGTTVALHIFLGLGIVLLTYGVAAIAHNRRTALLAAFLVAICKPLLVHEQFLLLETLQVFVAMLFFWLLLRVKRWSWWTLLGHGLLFGFLLTIRSNIALFLPALVYWIVCQKLTREKRGQARGRVVATTALLLVLGTAVAVLPYTVRNVVLSKQLVLLGTNVGQTLYIGNHRQATGLQGFPPGFWQVHQQAQQLPPAQARQLWLDKTIESYQGNPLPFLLLLVKKACLFCGAWEIPNNFSVQILERFSLLLRLPLLPYGLLASLALAALLQSVRKRRALGGAWLLLLLFVLCYFVSALVLPVHARFRLVLLPPLAIAAALYLQSWPEIRRRGQKAMARELVQLLLAVGLIHLLLNYNAFLPSQLYGFGASVFY